MLSTERETEGPLWRFGLVVGWDPGGWGTGGAGGAKFSGGVRVQSVGTKRLQRAAS